LSNDPCINMQNKNMKDYLKVEGYLTNDNFELIEKVKYFEDLNVWQVVKFLYVIIEVGFGVLVGQATCTTNGHNSFKNWGSIPLQVTTILRIFL